MGLSYKHTTGWRPAMPTGDGQLYFPFIKLTEPEELLTITFEHEATAAAEKVAWRAQTPRLIRLSAQGAALTTAGTAYSYKTFILDLAGKWESFDKLDEDKGNDIVKGIFRVKYNATAASRGRIIIVNEVASLP
jgi:hypothetical protein